MKSFLEFQKSKRIDVSEEGSWESRVAFTAMLKDFEKNWLQKNNDIQVAEAMLDVNPSERSAYLNRIDAQYTGKGYARELLAYIILECKKHGLKTITTYIENNNSNSRNMVTALNFIEIEKKEHGEVYQLTL